MTRANRKTQTLGTWRAATQMAILLALGAAAMMAMAVEIYHADTLPAGIRVSAATHAQAFSAGCAGFLPALLCLQRLNSFSWSRAFSFTAPWLVLIAPAVLTVSSHLPWFWALAIAIPLGIAAYRMMLRIARTSLS